MSPTSSLFLVSRSFSALARAQTYMYLELSPDTIQKPPGQLVSQEGTGVAIPADFRDSLIRTSHTDLEASLLIEYLILVRQTLKKNHSNVTEILPLLGSPPTQTHELAANQTLVSQNNSIFELLF